MNDSDYLLYGCKGKQGVISWTNDQIKKNWNLYKEHQKTYRCKECMQKHLLLCEGYSMENAQFTKNKKYLGMATRFRNERKKLLQKKQPKCTTCTKKALTSHGGGNMPRKCRGRARRCKYGRRKGSCRCRKRPKR